MSPKIHILALTIIGFCSGFISYFFTRFHEVPAILLGTLFGLTVGLYYLSIKKITPLQFFLFVIFSAGSYFAGPVFLFVYSLIILALAYPLFFSLMLIVLLLLLLLLILFGNVKKNDWTKNVAALLIIILISLIYLELESNSILYLISGAIGTFLLLVSFTSLIHRLNSKTFIIILILGTIPYGSVSGWASAWLWFLFSQTGMAAALGWGSTQSSKNPPQQPSKKMIIMSFIVLFLLFISLHEPIY